ncbi:hypothetical protein [Staphylococcus xylosus]
MFYYKKYKNLSKENKKLKKENEKLEKRLNDLDSDYIEENYKKIDDKYFKPYTLVYTFVIYVMFAIALYLDTLFLSFALSFSTMGVTYFYEPFHEYLLSKKYGSDNYQKYFSKMLAKDKYYLFFFYIAGLIVAFLLYMFSSLIK